MFTPTSRDLIGCIDLLLTLNMPPNYNGHHKSTLTQVENLAFASQIAVIMFELVAYEQETNASFTEYQLVQSSNIPHLAIFHFLREYGKCDILPSTYKELFGENPELEKSFLAYTKHQLTDFVSNEFYNYFFNFGNEFELKVYKASIALAEFFGNNTSDLLILNEYKELPIIRELFNSSPKTREASNLIELFEDFLSQKNIIRWRPFRPCRNFSVLAHSFNVAIYNYLLLLNSNPHNSKLAEHGFFVGLYHDIPEIWTGDIPSPLKKVVPTLNETIEQLEIKKLETEVFKKLPVCLVPKFKKLMLELLPEEEKTCYKLGDSLDSYVEASVLIQSPFAKKQMEHILIKGVLKNEKNSPIIKVVFKKLCKDANISTIKVYWFKLKNRMHRLFKPNTKNKL